MSKQLRLDVAQLTDVGRKRPHNEDNMAYVIPKDTQVMARKGALFIVADGMGGHAAGEVASEIAVDTVSNVYYQDDSEDVTVSLLNAIKRANTLIHQRAAENMQRSGMGTTCVAAVLRGGTAYIANVGDSRAYLIRGGQVKQVSQDHSWVEEQVRAGWLTRDQARSHAQRNVITRCLGTQADVEIDVFSENLEEGDTIILCTDGLSGLVSDEELGTIASQFVPQESVYHLVERANENGGPDNITAIVVRVAEVGWEAPSTRRPNGRLNGYDASEDSTAILGRVPSSSMVGVATWTENGRSASGVLRMPSGTLTVPDGVAAATPTPAPRPARKRLFYPTVAISVLLLIALLSVGAYYFFLLAPDVDGNLQNAEDLVTTAQTSVKAGNPEDALQKLQRSQQILLHVKSSVYLTETQRTRLGNLQERSFLPTVKQAITLYNKKHFITALPCPDPQTEKRLVNTGSAGTQPASLAVVLDERGNALRFVLGENNKLYRILGTDQPTLLEQKVDGTIHLLAGSGSRLFVLVENQGKFVLRVFFVDQSGALKAPDGLADGITVDDMNQQKNTFKPGFLAAWEDDAYLLLQPATVGSSGKVIDFQLMGDKGDSKVKGAPTKGDIALNNTDPLAAMTAFPKHQLFFLTKSGQLLGSRMTDTTAVSTEPVQMNDQVAAPLTVRAQDFTVDKDVPVVVASGQSQGAVSFPQAHQLSSGVRDDKNAHLFIVDSTGHRIIDLQTTTIGGNTVAPTPTAAGTPTVGGGLAGGATVVTMKVSQQYTTSSYVDDVKSIASDPKGITLNLLSGPNASLSLTTITIQGICKSAAS